MGSRAPPLQRVSRSLPLLQFEDPEKKAKKVCPE